MYIKIVRESQKKVIKLRKSELITNEIIKMLNESEENSVEIQRNVFANGIGCAPSQINYVISSRFTPEQGYIIESRRGGGGYIRIKRLIMDHSSAIMHIVNSIGDSLDPMSARILIENCLQTGLLMKKTQKLCMPRCLIMLWQISLRIKEIMSERHCLKKCF